MSYFEGQTPNWQHRRQQSWDPQQASSRSGSMPASPREHGGAFTAQFEEITRASDNLAKSGKGLAAPGRRETTPLGGTFMRQYPEIDARLAGPQRHHSVSEYEGIRSHSSHSSSSLQGYLANQRFGPRSGEGEQMIQAKRRAAAQRERELRNYHQEQQYNRNLSGAKSDRSMSPSAMNEDDRRELIARQHRALYGNESNLYVNDGSSTRPTSQDARVLAAASSGHGSSPLAFDHFGVPSSSLTEGSGPPTTGTTKQPRSRSNSTSPPSANPGSFAMYENGQQPINRAQTSSPGGSPTRQGSKGPTAPIGTRPAQASVPGKRNTPPMPSPLSYGFSNDKNAVNERSSSAASNPTAGGAEKGGVNLGWGGNNGPWGPNKNSLGVQASVWG